MIATLEKDLSSQDLVNARVVRTQKNPKFSTKEEAVGALTEMLKKRPMTESELMTQLEVGSTSDILFWKTSLNNLLYSLEREEVIECVRAQYLRNTYQLKGHEYGIIETRKTKFPTTEAAEQGVINTLANGPLSATEIRSALSMSPTELIIGSQHTSSFLAAMVRFGVLTCEDRQGAANLYHALPNASNSQPKEVLTVDTVIEPIALPANEQSLEKIKNQLQSF